MASKEQKSNLLSSWKEIATYLDCNERTCYRWEKNFDLPVHRIEGASKSRVYAYKDELEEWRREKIANKSLFQPGSTRRIHWPKGLYVLFPLVLAFLLYFSYINIFHKGEPADFKIEKSDFVVLSEKGRELWRYKTGIYNLQDDKFYREKFQLKRSGDYDHIYPPWLLIKD
jgi:hypothetical protein